MFHIVSKTIKNTTLTYLVFYMPTVLIHKTSVYKVFGVDKLDIMNVLPNMA